MVYYFFLMWKYGLRARGFISTGRENGPRSVGQYEEGVLYIDDSLEGTIFCFCPDRDNTAFLVDVFDGRTAAGLQLPDGTVAPSGTSQRVVDLQIDSNDPLYAVLASRFSPMTRTNN